MTAVVKGFQDRWNRTDQIEVDNQDKVLVTTGGKNQWVSVGDYLYNDKFKSDGDYAARLAAVLQTARGTYHRSIKQAAGSSTTFQGIPNAKTANPPKPGAVPTAKQQAPDFANQALRQLADERKQNKDSRPVTNTEIIARARQLIVDYYCTPNFIKDMGKAKGGMPPAAPKKVA